MKYYNQKLCCVGKHLWLIFLELENYGKQLFLSTSIWLCFLRDSDNETLRDSDIQRLRESEIWRSETQKQRD